MARDSTLGKLDMEHIFEDIVYPCYMLSLNREQDEVEVKRDKKVIAKFKLSSFPKEYDLNQVDCISKVLEIVKKEGCVGLMNKLQLKTA